MAQIENTNDLREVKNNFGKHPQLLMSLAISMPIFKNQTPILIRFHWRIND